MQARSFALTKIQPPRARPGLIARNGLEERLGAAMAGARLVLVSAPAGFGKTGALTRQLGLLPPNTALAWVACDEDDDLGRFANCLVAALEPYDLPWRISPDVLVAAQDGQRASRQALCSELLNALAATDVPRGLIVLDDAHRVSEPAVFEFLDGLIERLPVHWGVVIASRVDPPLALPKLRAHGDLAEFRQTDLSFDEDDVAALAVNRSPGWSESDLAELQHRTQGWAAGLCLALSNTPNRTQALRGSLRDRHVFDYLASEVLDGLDAAMRDFLLRCSVLPELTASRCAAVCGDVRPELMLEDIERRGLFVSVRGGEGDGSEVALCLHDLFRDCLEDRLRREMPAEVPELLRRAALTETDALRRVTYLARAGDWSEAEAALLETGTSLIAQSALGQLQRLLDLFPQPQQLHSPVLQMLRGLAGWVRLDWASMADAMHRAALGFEASGNVAGCEQASVFRAIALAGAGRLGESVDALGDLASQARDRKARTCALSVSAWHALDGAQLDQVGMRYSALMDLLEQSGDPILWYQCGPRSMYIGLPGAHPPMQRYVDGVLRRFGDSPSALRAVAYRVQAWLAFWCGHWQAAREALACSNEDMRWIGTPMNLRAMVQPFEALLLALSGEASAALSMVHTLQCDFASGNPDDPRYFLHLHLRFWELRVADLVDDRGEVLRIASELPPWIPGPAALIVDQRATLAARVALAEGRLADACEGFEQAIALGMRIDCFGQLDEVRMRLAHTRLQLGEVDAAAAALAPTLAHATQPGAEPAGHWVLAGARILGDLARFAWQSRLRPAEVALMARWADEAASLRGIAGRPAQAMAAPRAASNGSGGAASVTLPFNRAGQRPAARGEPASGHGISEREREVLERMAAGDSNKLIARALDLSPHTVKRHVANILDKLELSTRGQAAAWFLHHHH